ncbi:19451_t:CDS:2 [Racocetra fulgida]|uniref:19451_t:CDS:1 n=1 Tax=Racocetra fulgida TaxID=60492 RepID=A0A9N9F0H0_9GLOM|nr:19451_t:CDS:2 [Racocetra fulgida]
MIKEISNELSNEFEDNSNVPKLSYLRIFLLNLWFGFNAWGGPVAQIALIKDVLVIKEKWITIPRFNRVFGVYQILPGPEATELCMFFGCLAGGRFGVGLQNDRFNASFRALQPIVAAMVLRAVHKIADHALISHTTHRFTFMFIERKIYWLGLIVIFLEIIGYGIYIGINKDIPSPSTLGIGVAKADPGSAEAVTIGQWMSATTFLNSIAIGNIIPSPLVMFSTFIGFQAGYLWGGQSVGYGLLVRNQFLAAFFDGISGTVVGIIAVIAMDLLKTSIVSTTGLANVSPQDLPVIQAKNSSLSAVLYVLTLAVLHGFKKPYLSLWLIIFGGVAGQFLFLNHS